MKRIYLPLELPAGASISLPTDVQHRLHRVMRMGQGDHLELFNGDGTVAAAEISDAKCRFAQITQILPTIAPLPRKVLVLGIPKREALESALRQATEMGATDILPLKTRFAQVSRINVERAQSIVIEAAEQCERATLPVIHAVSDLDDFLKGLTTPCLWAYERLEGDTTGSARADSVLVGPEGGFSQEEVELLRAHPLVTAFSFGPTILRTDTAVVAGLARL